MSDTIRSNQQLDHERLDVYAAAVALDGAVLALTRKAGRGHGWLCDQANRASASVVLNLAEALGREGQDRPRIRPPSRLRPATSHLSDYRSGPILNLP